MTKGVLYRQAITADYEQYLAERDPTLGWPAPSPSGTGDAREAASNRMTPTLPDGTHPCVSLYGDSFTWSSEVDHEQAWGNVLSRLLGCKVSNYGVGGYGSDQAYLRFRANTTDRSPVVFLNHTSENILRNVNQFRDFLYPGRGVGFKPRFVLERGGLRLIALPSFPAELYPRVVENPVPYLPYDYFVPGGSSGTTTFAFPFTWSLIKSSGHFHIRATLVGQPWYASFYRRDHESGALAVTTALLASFETEAHARGQHPIITVIPTGLDLVYFKEYRRWVYQPLLNALAVRSITALNFGDEIIDHVGDGDPCALFDDCSAHYNERGYALLARIAHGVLVRDRLLDALSDTRQ